jgi:hypothetical protein
MDGKADAAGKIPDKNGLDRGPLGWLAPPAVQSIFGTHLPSSPGNASKIVEWMMRPSEWNDFVMLGLKAA